VRLLLLIYFVCTRGALRCFFFFLIKLQLLIKKKKVRFCHDLWCGDTTLKETLSVLFGIDCIKDTYCDSCGIF
jgi:hypothetical protein